MELIDKINAIIGRLEQLKNQSNPDLNSLGELIDTIENEELLKLDDEFDEWRNSIYDEGEPDEKAEQLMDQIGDLFIQADELINSIREQFGIEDVYAEENFDDEEDDELSRSLWDDEEDYSDEEDDDEYEIVLNEVSKSALKTIGVENIDKQSINLMGTILIGISSEESDDAIAGRAFAQLVVSGYMLPMDDIKEMCKDTREKCKKQLFGLQIAYSNLREYQCSAEDALSQIQLFL